MAAVSTSGKRTRRGPTSKVWLDFEEVTAMHGGKEVRVSAICLHCKHTLSAKSSSGTGHLIRHLDLCPAKKENDITGRTQSLLKFNADDSVVHWEYSPSIARTELCRLIATLDMPLCFGESDAFQEYYTRAHNPRYPPSIRTKLTKIFQVYESKFGDACLSTPSLPGGVFGMAIEAWHVIYGDEEAFTATPDNGAGTSGSPGLSELSSYLDSDTEVAREKEQERGSGADVAARKKDKRPATDQDKDMEGGGRRHNQRIRSRAKELELHSFSLAVLAI
ncbi:hypothetical protein U9M48_026643 [Paspalum notatum var. saurae]|uniref:BED-type domain-containing protein n=1 Tax=Paspalum notatum var. saurae TaxID=547442 RepID=A0AAQ3WZ19_PASNO